MLDTPEGVVASALRRTSAVVTSDDDDRVLHPSGLLEVVHQFPDRLVHVHQHLRGVVRVTVLRMRLVDRRGVTAKKRLYGVKKNE